MQIFKYILLIILAFFLAPILSFGIGFLAGLIIKITIGTSIVSGLNLIGLNISLNDLPLFFGTLSIIGDFFKSYFSRDSLRASL